MTDRRTDGQTDGRNCDSICALSIYAVARKKHEEIICTVLYAKTSDRHDGKDKVKQVIDMKVKTRQSTYLAYKEVIHSFIN